jgi:hypothetical protein
MPVGRSRACAFRRLFSSAAQSRQPALSPACGAEKAALVSSPAVVFLGAMLLAAVTPRGLADEETIVEITPMIAAGVGRLDGERLHGVDRLEASSTFGQPLIQRVVALRIIAGAGRSGMKPQVLSSP